MSLTRTWVNTWTGPTGAVVTAHSSWLTNEEGQASAWEKMEDKRFQWTPLAPTPCSVALSKDPDGSWWYCISVLAPGLFRWFYYFFNSSQNIQNYLPPNTFLLSNLAQNTSLTFSHYIFCWILLSLKPIWNGETNLCLSYRQLRLMMKPVTLHGTGMSRNMM